MISTSKMQNIIISSMSQCVNEYKMERDVLFHLMRTANNCTMTKHKLNNKQR